jgi:hypothetical protein
VLKKNIFFIFFLLLNFKVVGQKVHLTISGVTEKETAIIDSLGYQKQHTNLKSITDEGILILDKLNKKGYIEAVVSDTRKESDTAFHVYCKVGSRIKSIHIYTKENHLLRTLNILKPKEDTLKVPFEAATAFLNNMVQDLEKKGYSLAKIKLINFKKYKDYLVADLAIATGNKRTLNDIVINGYDQFPKSHKKNINKLFKNTTFTQESIKKIHAEFQRFRFVNQNKYPEILFTKDTTKVYVYLEKSKANTFDGLIGFSNDEKSKLRFNGYLDLKLSNLLNSGEFFSLFWKSDGQQQTTFNTGLELPYIFKSPLGLKTSLQIFKQDSTFQNTKTAIELGYLFNYNTRLYLGYQSTESSDIQNQNNASISDYKNAFTTINFEYAALRPEDYFVPEKTKVNIKAGVGSRDTPLNKEKQLFFELDLLQVIPINDKNLFRLRSKSFYLKSGTYIVNELYRFGGINSIRGFNENSLQANLFSSLLTEYRYLISPGLQAYTIVDYGYFNDKVAANNSTLLGIGIGFAIATKNGRLNIIYANGSTKEQQIKLNNSIIHIGFTTAF